MMKQNLSPLPVYVDKYIKLFHDKITFNPWFFPETQKTIKYSCIRNIGERKSNLVSKKPRISGSRDFINWFTWDVTRQHNKKLVFLETDHRIFKKIWFVSEDPVFVIRYLKNYMQKISAKNNRYSKRKNQN